VRLGEQTLRNQIKAITSRIDARPSLREITSEALVIGGKHDTVTPIECSEEIASLLPHATLHIVNDAGHCAPWERPQEVNRVMHDFLDDLHPPAVGLPPKH
jgi:pimeloyl-ACP methyl ester carboxylesterase